MTKKFLLLALILLSPSVFGQSFTNVTGTLMDVSGQNWTFATVQAQLVPAFGNPNPPLNQGHAVTDNIQVVATDGTGTFNLTLDDNSKITPTGSLWKFLLCPNANVAICSSTLLFISGTNMNISASLNSIITVPSVFVSPYAGRAYNDSEAIGSTGALYWRTTDNTLRGCVGFPCTWQPIGNGVASNSFYQTVFTGTGAPSVAVGGNGALYINTATTTGELYQNNFGIWTDVGGVGITKATHTTNYTLLNTDVTTYQIMNGTNLTITMPATLWPIPPIGGGSTPNVTITNANGTSLTVQGNGHTISGQTSVTIPANSTYVITLNGAATAWNETGLYNTVADNNGNQWGTNGIFYFALGADHSELELGNGFFLSDSLGNNTITYYGNGASPGTITVQDSLTQLNGGLAVSTVATSPSNAPICPNGPGGKFTITGCAAGGTTTGSGTAGNLTEWTTSTALGNAPIIDRSATPSWPSGRVTSSLQTLYVVPENAFFTGNGCTASTPFCIGQSWTSSDVNNGIPPLSGAVIWNGFNNAALTAGGSFPGLVGLYVINGTGKGSETGTLTAQATVIAESNIGAENVTNTYNLFSMAPTGGTGQFNHYYGLYVETATSRGFTPTDPWGVYVVGDKSFFGNMVQYNMAAFSTYPTCTTALQGNLAGITDSTASTFGSTITGGGSSKVMGFCDGSHWTVAAI